MAPPFALPPPDFPLPAYVRQAESGLLMRDQRLKKAILPGLCMPPGLMGGGAKLTSLEFIDSATSTSRTITGPAGIQSGDLLVLCDRTLNKGGGGSSSVPTGFTQIVATSGASGWSGTRRQNCSYKIANGSEANASIAGMDADFIVQKVLLVFRGNIPIRSVTPGSINDELTQGNPTSQTVTASTGNAPLIVIGAYGTGPQSSSLNPRSMTPTKDGEDGVSDGEQGSLYLAYKIYDASPANVSVDMDDEGNDNTLQSFYLEVA